MTFYYFYDPVDTMERVRVCKFFFKNPLDIKDRRIRIVLEKMNHLADVVMDVDQRGKHCNHCTID